MPVPFEVGEMTPARHTTACGLFCDECLSSQKQFLERIQQFEKWLSQMHFEDYIRLIAPKHPHLQQQTFFWNTLQVVKKLSCPHPCSQASVSQECQIVQCTVEKGFSDCWQCEENESCGLLAPIKRLHAVAHHLDELRRTNEDDWSQRKSKQPFQPAVQPL
jgi:hypothetical protein